MYRCNLIAHFLSIISTCGICPLCKQCNLCGADFDLYILKFGFSPIGWCESERDRQQIKNKEPLYNSANVSCNNACFATSRYDDVSEVAKIVQKPV